VGLDIGSPGPPFQSRAPNLDDFVGRLRVDFVLARDAYHGRGVYTWISQRGLNITLKASVAFGLLAA